MKDLRYTYKTIKRLRRDGVDLYDLPGMLDKVGDDIAKLDELYTRLYWAGRLHESPKLAVEKAEEELEDVSPAEFYNHVNRAYRKCFSPSSGDGEA